MTRLLERRPRSISWLGACLCLSLLLSLPGLSWARDRDGFRPPPGHREYRHQGHRYYYHGGHYYRPHGHAYVPVRPPRGFFIDALPIGFAAVMLAGITYYTFAGVYYRPAPGGYVVVDPPAGVVVPAPPPAPVYAPPPGGSVYSVSVMAPSLNVRSGPGPGFPVIDVVGRGTTMVVLGQNGGWLLVQLPSGQTGWVGQQFTAPAAPTPSG